MIAALSFLLDYEKIENDQDSDDSSSDDEVAESPQVILSRETIYKVRSNDKTLNFTLCYSFSMYLSYILFPNSKVE